MRRLPSKRAKATRRPPPSSSAWAETRLRASSRAIGFTVFGARARFARFVGAARRARVGTVWQSRLHEKPTGSRGHAGCLSNGHATDRGPGRRRRSGCLVRRHHRRAGLVRSAPVSERAVQRLLVGKLLCHRQHVRRHVEDVRLPLRNVGLRRLRRRRRSAAALRSVHGSDGRTRLRGSWEGLRPQRHTVRGAIVHVQRQGVEMRELRSRAKPHRVRVRGHVHRPRLVRQGLGVLVPDVPRLVEVRRGHDRLSRGRRRRGRRRRGRQGDRLSAARHVARQRV